MQKWDERIILKDRFVSFVRQEWKRFSGKVKVFKLGDEGRDQIVRLAKTGDVLGYRSLISHEVYTASASALEDTICCFIPAGNVYKILDRNPGVAMRLMRIFSDDLRKAETRLTEMTQKPVRARLADALMLLKDTFGTREDGTLDVTLTREEIGNLMGTTTETAIRFISEFKKKKVIDLNGRNIKIRNLTPYLL